MVNESAAPDTSTDLFPIDRGSRWTDTDGPAFVVRSVSVDESGVTQVHIRTDTGETLGLTASDLRKRMASGEIAPALAGQEPSAVTNTNAREWMQVGTDPLRYEYGRPGASHGRPADVLAYVERERSGRFRWDVYRGKRTGKVAPSLHEAKERALSTLEERGVDL